MSILIIASLRDVVEKCSSIVELLKQLVELCHPKFYNEGFSVKLINVRLKDLNNELELFYKDSRELLEAWKEKILQLKSESLFAQFFSLAEMRILDIAIVNYLIKGSVDSSVEDWLSSILFCAREGFTIVEFLSDIQRLPKSYLSGDFIEKMTILLPIFNKPSDFAKIPWEDNLTNFSQNNVMLVVEDEKKKRLTSLFNNIINLRYTL